MFFVLSGYLITSLLIVEVRSTGRISIKQFYIRRARRLLPALFTLLLAVAAVGAFWLPQQARPAARRPARRARLRHQLVADRRRTARTSATAGDRPDLLTHLWSLAVEEQYYLIWPLVLMLFAAVRGPARAHAHGRRWPAWPRRPSPRLHAVRPVLRPVPGLLRHRHPGPGPAARAPPWRSRSSRGATGDRPPRGARHSARLASAIAALLGLAAVAAC